MILILSLSRCEKANEELIEVFTVMTVHTARQLIKSVLNVHQRNSRTSCATESDFGRSRRQEYQESSSSLAVKLFSYHRLRVRCENELKIASGCVPAHNASVF